MSKFYWWSSCGGCLCHWMNKGVDMIIHYIIIIYSLLTSIISTNYKSAYNNRCQLWIGFQFHNNTKIQRLIDLTNPKIQSSTHTHTQTRQRPALRHNNTKKSHTHRKWIQIHPKLDTKCLIYTPLIVNGRKAYQIQLLEVLELSPCPFTKVQIGTMGT